MAKRAFSKLYKLILCLAAIIFVVTLTSCDNLLFEDISEKVRACLDTAVVMSVNIHDDVGTNSSGIVCLSYENSSAGIEALVRNPRSFNLRAHYKLLSGSTPNETYYSSFAEYSAVPSAQKSDISIYPSSYDGSRLEIIFSSNFLKSRELNNRDISGDIVLYDYDTMRYFDPYTVQVRANSVPPNVNTVMLQRSSANGQYILCFYFPKVCQIDQVHSDTHTLIINNKAYYFISPSFDGKFYTSPSCQTENTNFTTTRPTGMLPLTDNSDSFPDDSYTNYVPVFLYTGDAVTTDTRTYTVYVEDEEGLHGTPVTVSNIERTLTAPTVSTSSNSTYDTGDDGNYSIVVSHNGLCLDGTYTEAVEIRYVVTYQDGSSSGDTSAGSASPGAPATIHLPRGTYSEIAIYAKKSGCISSDTVTINNITVRRSPNFYVSATGSDSNVGIVNDPLRTIQGAVSKFNSECPDATTCNIYLLSNITPSSDDFGSGITSLVTLSAKTEASAKTYNILPYSSGSGTTTYTINANRSESQNGNVISVAEYNTLNLSNLIIRGGRTGTGTNGGGISVGSNANVTLTNYTVTNNHVSDGNGGGIFNDGGEVTLNSSSVTGNSAYNGGGGVYNAGTLNISGTVNVTGNTGDINEGTGSTNNVYLENGKYITVTGSLNSASRIGVKTQTAPTAAIPVTFTSSFVTNSGLSVSNAGIVFISDSNPAFAVISSGNELALSPSGGNIGGNTMGYSITLTGPSYVSIGSTLKVTATIMNGNTIVTPQPLDSWNWDIRLKDIAGNAVEMSTGGTVFTNGGSNRLPIPQSALIYEGETYILTARVTYTPSGWPQGISESAQFLLQVPAGLVRVNGATVSGAVGSGDTASSVFISGRTVTIPNMFVCDHEVTQAEYQAVMGTNPSHFDNSNGKTPDAVIATGETQANRPVELLNWYDALVYCNKRSLAEGLTPCYTISGSTDTNAWGTVPTSNNATWNAATCNFNANGYRLPTEAEWEYIARGGNNGIPSTQYIYSGSNVLDNVAWYTENSGSKTHEVKRKGSNSLGIYDMSGNVWEWCWDKTDLNVDITADTPDTGAASGSRRILRGGTSFGQPNICTVANRGSHQPYLVGSDGYDYGLRVVRTIP